MDTPKLSRWFRFLGIVAIVFGAIFILYGGGAFFSSILEGQIGDPIFLAGMFLLAAGILKILAIKKLWQYKKIGIILYAINEILLVLALGAFYSKMEENWILIVMGVFALFGVGFMIYFKKVISKSI